METVRKQANTAPAPASLNRTMQYGNNHTWIQFVSVNVFKSYYVVWKHSGSSVFAEGESMFKSYYVVWKPCKDNYSLLENTIV